MQWGFSIAKLILKGRPLQLFGFYDVGGGIIPPPPPYIIAANNTTILTELSGMTYEEGEGPSNDSILFRIQAAGLTPSAGDIVVTPPTDFEIFDGTNWVDIPFNIPYSSGALYTEVIYKARLKSGLGNNNYSQTLIISGADAPDWNITLTGSVTLPLQFIIATGGTITEDGDYKIHTFTSSNNFEISQISTNPSFNGIEYLIVGGGAGGGNGNGDTGGGGGGAGGFLTGLNTAVVGTYPVVIGSGGAGTPSGTSIDGANGSSSSYNTIVSSGGGGGATQRSNVGPGKNGASGGGASFGSAGGTGIVGQGFAGGSSTTTQGRGGGGGGGASEVGVNGTTTKAGNGGNGLTSSISGGLNTYAGGGGGGFANLITQGLGGAGGGGNGSLVLNGAGSNATINTGGGGGGGSNTHNTSGGNGGSGIIILRYRFQ